MNWSLPPHPTHYQYPSNPNHFTGTPANRASGQMGTHTHTHLHFLSLTQNLALFLSHTQSNQVWVNSGDSSMFRGTIHREGVGRGPSGGHDPHRGVRGNRGGLLRGRLLMSLSDRGGR